MNADLKTDQLNFLNLKLLEPLANLSQVKSTNASEFTLTMNSLLNEVISEDSGLNSISSETSEIDRESLVELSQVCIGDSLLTIEKIANECSKKNESDKTNEASVVSRANPSFRINLRNRLICCIVLYISFVFILLFIYMAGYFGSKYL